MEEGQGVQVSSAVEKTDWARRRDLRRPAHGLAMRSGTSARIPTNGRFPSAGSTAHGESPPQRTDLAVGRVRQAIEADRLAVSLSLMRDRITIPLARAARRFREGRVWFEFGYARLEDHCRERFGRCGRWLRDLAALGELVVELPELAGSLTGADGGAPIGRVKAQLIGKIATSATCGFWIAQARTLSVRELRDRVQHPFERGAEDVGRARDGEVGIDLPSRSDEADRPPSIGSNESTEETREERDEEELHTVRIAAPRAVIAAFTEARELYGAVTGGPACLTEFVEALVAEARTGPVAPLEEPSVGHVNSPAEARERAMADRTERWADLNSLNHWSELLADVREKVEILESAITEAERGSSDTDALIRSLIAHEEDVERNLGVVLAAMSAMGSWQELRFTSLGHYAEERLGMSRSTAEERARLARGLAQRPTLRESYERGRLGSAAALLLLRLAKDCHLDHRTESEWASHAEEITFKRLRDEARLALRAEALAETTLDDRTEGTLDMQAVPRDPHPPGTTGPATPSDSAWSASIARRPGDAIARVNALALAASRDASGLRTLWLKLPESLAAPFVGAVRSRRDQVEQALRNSAWISGSSTELDGGRDPRDSSVPTWEGPEGAEPRSLGAGSSRTFSTAIPALPEWIGLLALVEEFVATWDDPKGHPRRHGDEIYIRDGWRCMAPGCTSRKNLEDHHIIYRSRGGSDDLWNRVTLCRFHHQQGEHGGLMRCRGKAPLGLIWSLGASGVGGNFRNERRLS